MTRGISKGVIFFIAALLFSLFSTHNLTAKAEMLSFDPVDLNPKVESGEYSQIIDTFMVIFDSSASMSNAYSGIAKIDIAKEIVARMAATIPRIEVLSGIRTFGNSLTFSPKTTLELELAQFDMAAFKGAVKDLKAAGPSPLCMALDEAGKDLTQGKGDMALIVISDGLDMTGTPVASAEALKQKYGTRLCIFTVLIGDNWDGRQVMRKISKAGQCGYFTTADEIACGKGMADFVKNVFFAASGDRDGDGVMDPKDRCPGTPKGVRVDKNGCPPDSDGDGVYDYLDACPGTPMGIKVDEKGCPLDSDGDGVWDSRDKCPGTYKGAKVNEMGCWVIEGVNFDTAKWDIKPSFYPGLDDIVEVLNKNPSLKLEVQGHTDNVGTKAYNQGLSQKRAESVVDYLAQKGIDKARLTSVGYGLTRPMADNSTEQGRAQNRRVQLSPIY